MNTEDIMKLTSELDTLANETAHLHTLLTRDILKCWRGDAAQSCLRESRDNRECAEEAIGAFRAWLGEVSGQQRLTEERSLPESFLL